MGCEPAEALGVQRLHALGELLVGATQAVGLLAVGDGAHAAVLHLGARVLLRARALGGDAVLVGARYRGGIGEIYGRYRAGLPPYWSVCMMMKASLCGYLIVVATAARSSESTEKSKVWMNCCLGF